MHNTRHSSPSRQAGMSTIGILFLIVVVALGGMLALKMIPSYIEYFSVEEVVASLEGDVKLRNGGPQKREIRNLILKRLRINGVYNFDKDKISIEKTQSGVRVTIAYEVREHFVGNVDVIMSFKSQADL